jgi:hypothetical protein
MAILGFWKTLYDRCSAFIILKTEIILNVQLHKYIFSTDDIKSLINAVPKPPWWEYKGTLSQLIISKEKIIKLNIKWNETLEHLTNKNRPLYTGVNK